MAVTLVTGATGFLGGAVARRLLRDGDEVVGIGRDPAAGAALARDGVRFVPVDLEDGRGLREAARGATRVVHCAARASPFGTEAQFRRANLVATEHVVAVVAELGARLVHVSTPSVYHTGRDRSGVREDEPLPPLAAMLPYARTKALAEEVVRRSGVRAVILRPRAIYGPGDRVLVPRIARALARGRLPVIGTGEVVADLTYVDNVVDAVVCGLARGDGGTFNVTDGRPVHLWDQVRAIAAALGLPPPRGRVPKRVALLAARAIEAAYVRFRPGVEPPVTVYGVSVLSTGMTLDLGAARRDLGYAPAVDPDEGLARALAWLRAHRAEVGA